MKAGIAETLREVAGLVADGQEHAIAFGNFLAFLDPGRIQEAVQDEPPLLAGSVSSGAMMDAVYAAAAELLMRKHNLPAPSWTEGPCRFLEDWHYPSKNQRLNELLLQETPEPFRRRRLVCSANALEVA